MDYDSGVAILCCKASLPLSQWFIVHIRLCSWGLQFPGLSGKNIRLWITGEGEQACHIKKDGPARARTSDLCMNLIVKVY